MVHRDGSIRWFMARGQVVRDGNGTAVGMAGTGTDITARKRSEETLRQAEELNRRIVESSGDCVKILDLDGRLLYMNPEGVRALELADAGELLQRPLAGFFDGEVRNAAEAAISVAREGGRGRFQYLMPTATGMPKWWDAVVTPITDGGGSVVQLLAVSRDITERRREEAFRAAQHQVLEMIATGSPLPVVLDSVVRLVESQATGMQCTILLLDDDGVTIRHGSAPGMPAGYLEALTGLAIGPRAGSCGTAMYLGQPVIVTDVLTDPLWEDYLDVAAAIRFPGLLVDADLLPGRGRSWGRWRCTTRSRGRRGDDEWRLIETAADIARIAIEQRRASQALQHSEARNQAILRAIPDWMFLTTLDGVFLDFHAKDPRALHAPPAAFLGRRIRDVLPPHIADALAMAFARTARFGRAREDRVHARRRRQRAVLRGDDRHLRRRQDPQHRPRHHRPQARRARGRLAPARIGPPRAASPRWASCPGRWPTS